MDGNFSQYDLKIRKILEKFLQPDFKIKNDVYLNSLLTYLSGNAEIGCKLSSSNYFSYPIFPEWILQAVVTWESSKPNPDILSFAINLTSFISKEEPTFELLNSQQTYERLITLAKPTEANTSPSVKLAFIKLISSFLDHNLGLQWIISTNYWHSVLQLSLINQTVYIKKDGHEFMAKLLDKMLSFNETFCVNVVQVIMTPLSDSAFSSIKDKESMEISDEDVYKSMSPTLLLISDILETVLSNTVNERDYKLMLIFTNEFHLERCLHNFLMIAQSADFIFDLHRILYMLIFFDVVLSVNKHNEITIPDLICNTKKVFNIYNTNITKGLVKNILKLCYLGYNYWRHISMVIPEYTLNFEKLKRDTNSPLLFENQIMALQLLPVFVVSFRLLGMEKLENNEDEFRDAYMDKLMGMLTVSTLRIGYQWKDWLSKAPNLFDHATLALQYILKSKGFYTRAVGATIFQTLIYCLKDTVHCLKENPDKVEVLAKESNYTTILLDAIAVHIEEFKLSWRDSVETICVMNVAFDFLSLPSWPPKLVVKGLKLVDISISNYMSPNLALLIDRINDSTMAFIGPLLYAKLHDRSWEVRDSALEVLCTISHNANTKFPSFQKIVLDSQLPELVVKIALRDGEGFVRATALKCLQEMVQIQDFWTNILETHDLNEKVIDILQNETEGIVRKEAASLMGTIYKHKHFPNSLLNKVYDVMTHAVIADLHWEVKNDSLKFWDVVIKNHLQHQGMIDGSFPTVVFSKEHRKIVTLTEIEVKKRLIKVLNQLSEIGCLAVLIAAIQDDCDLEVSKNATKITQQLVELLKKHKINFENAVLSTPPSPLLCDDGVPSPSTYSTSISSVSSNPSSPYSASSPEFFQNSPISFSDQSVADMTESVINDIINSRDVNLLTNIYNPSDQMNVNRLPMRSKQIVTANDFLKFALQDLESRIQEKQKWLRGIDEVGSLLDDILREYDQEEVNSMDCY